MDAPVANTLSKKERLCGKTTISTLIGKGRWTGSAHIKCCHMEAEGAELSRIMVSVPKKFFKRAVKRNLLKRRLREAYRTQKSILGDTHSDIMFSWTSPEIADSSVIREEVASILRRIAR